MAADDLDAGIRALEAEGADLSRRLLEAERQLLGAEQHQHDLCLLEERLDAAPGLEDLVTRLRADLEASVGRLLALTGAAAEDALSLKGRLAALLSEGAEEEAAGAAAVLLRGLASENAGRLRTVEAALRRLRDLQGAYAEHRRRGLWRGRRLEGALAVRDLELRLAALEGRQGRMCRTVRELFAETLRLERREWLAGKHARRLRLQLDLLEARGGPVAAAAHRRLGALLEAEMAELVRRRGLLLRRHSWLLAEARGCSGEQRAVGLLVLRPAAAPDASTVQLYAEELRSASGEETATVRRRSDVLRNVFSLLREGLLGGGRGRLRDDVLRQLKLLLLPDEDPKIKAVVDRIGDLLEQWCLCEEPPKKGDEGDGEEEEVDVVTEEESEESARLRELRRSVMKLRGSCARIREKLQAATDKFFPCNDPPSPGPPNS